MNNNEKIYLVFKKISQNGGSNKYNPNMRKAISSRTTISSEEDRERKAIEAQNKERESRRLREASSLQYTNRNSYEERGKKEKTLQSNYPSSLQYTNRNNFSNSNSYEERERKETQNKERESRRLREASSNYPSSLPYTNSYEENEDVTEALRRSLEDQETYSSLPYTDWNNFSNSDSDEESEDENVTEALRRSLEDQKIHSSLPYTNRNNFLNSNSYEERERKAKEAQKLEIALRRSKATHLSKTQSNYPSSRNNFLNSDSDEESEDEDLKEALRRSLEDQKRLIKAQNYNPVFSNYPTRSLYTNQNNFLNNEIMDIIDQYVNSDLRKLSYLRDRNPRLIDENHDGNCLFSALSRMLYENPDNNESIRIEICDYLLANINYLTPFMATEIEGITDPYLYIYHMSRPTTFGGHMEIQAFCNLFGCIIFVHDHPDNNYNQTQSSGTIRLPTVIEPEPLGIRIIPTEFISNGRRRLEGRKFHLYRSNQHYQTLVFDDSENYTITTTT
jgi:hypothetical protein